VNVLLGISKLVGGIVGNSFALIADAINSLGDVVTTIIVLVGLRVAQHPPDEEHPYGHTRAEGIAACTVSTLLIVSALSVGWHALGQIGAEHEVPPVWTMWLAATNVVLTEGLYRYNRRVSKRTGSAAIMANAWDHRSDALSSLAVLIGLAAIRLLGESYGWVDEVTSLVVVAAILWAGVRLFRTSASELMDRQAEPELVENVRALARAVSGVEGVEKLWVRKSGLEYFADIHLQVAPQMPVAEGHRIGHVVKDRLLKEIPALRDVLVHLEPAAPAGVPALAGECPPTTSRAEP
jgi:cation diffusion facilitator family transporter